MRGSAGGSWPEGIVAESVSKAHQAPWLDLHGWRAPALLLLDGGAAQEQRHHVMPIRHPFETPPR
jgi:hypothetical protein